MFTNTRKFVRNSLYFLFFLIFFGHISYSQNISLRYYAINSATGNTALFSSVDDISANTIKGYSNIIAINKSGTASSNCPNIRFSSSPAYIIESRIPGKTGFDTFQSVSLTQRQNTSTVLSFETTPISNGPNDYPEQKIEYRVSCANPNNSSQVLDGSSTMITYTIVDSINYFQPTILNEICEESVTYSVDSLTYCPAGIDGWYNAATHNKIGNNARGNSASASLSFNQAGLDTLSSGFYIKCNLYYTIIAGKVINASPKMIQSSTIIPSLKSCGTKARLNGSIENDTSLVLQGKGHSISIEACPLNGTNPSIKLERKNPSIDANFSVVANINLNGSDLYLGPFSDASAYPDGLTYRVTCVDPATNSDIANSSTQYHLKIIPSATNFGTPTLVSSTASSKTYSADFCIDGVEGWYRDYNINTKLTNSANANTYTFRTTDYPDSYYFVKCWVKNIINSQQTPESDTFTSSNQIVPYPLPTKVRINGISSNDTSLVLQGFGQKLEIDGCPLNSYETKPSYKLETKNPSISNSFSLFGGTILDQNNANPRILTYYTGRFDNANTYPQGLTLKFTCVDPITQADIANSSTEYHIVISPSAVNYGTPRLVSSTETSKTYGADFCYDGVEGWYRSNDLNTKLANSQNSNTYSFSSSLTAGTPYIVKCTIQNIVSGNSLASFQDKGDSTTVSNSIIPNPLAYMKVSINGSTSNSVESVIAGYGKVFNVEGCTYYGSDINNTNVYVQGTISGLRNFGNDYLVQSTNGDKKYLFTGIINPTNLATNYPERKIIYSVSCYNSVTGEIIPESTTSLTLNIRSSGVDSPSLVSSNNTSATYSVTNICTDGVDGWYNLSSPTTALANSSGAYSFTITKEASTNQYFAKCLVNDLWDGTGNILSDKEIGSFTTDTISVDPVFQKVSINGSTNNSVESVIAGYGKVIDVKGCTYYGVYESNSYIRIAINIPGGNNSSPNTIYSVVSTNGDNKRIFTGVFSNTNLASNMYPERKINYEIACYDLSTNQAIPGSSTSLTLNILDGQVLSPELISSSESSFEYSVENICTEGVEGWYNSLAPNTRLTGSAGANRFILSAEADVQNYFAKCIVNNLWTGTGDIISSVGNTNIIMVEADLSIARHAGIHTGNNTIVTGGNVDALVIHSYGKVLEVAGCPLRTGQTQPDFAFEYRIPGRGNQNEFARTNLGYLEVASPGIYRYFTVPIGGDPTNVYPEGKIIYRVSCKDVSGNIIENSSTDYTIHIINQVEAFKPVVTDFNCGDLLNNTPNKGGFVTYSLNSNACYEGVDGWYDVNAGNRLVSGSAGHLSHTFRDDFAESKYIVKCSIRNIYQGSPSNRTTVNANSAYFYPKRRYLPPPVPRIFVTGKYGEFAKNHTSFEICADDALQFAFDGVFPAGKSFEDFKPYYDIHWSVFGDTYRGRKLANAYDTPVFQTNESGIVELMYQVKGTWERGASSYDNICPGYGSTIPQDPENKLIYDNNFGRLRVVNLSASAPKPLISSVSNFMICPDGTTDLVASNGNSGEYYWYLDSELLDSRNSRITIDRTYSSVQVKYRIDEINSLGETCLSSGSENFAIKSFNRPSQPVILGPEDNDHCEYETFSDLLRIQSSDAVEYKWSNSATTSSINATSFGIYTATIKDINGCESYPSEGFEIVSIARPAVTPISLIGNVFNCARDINGNEITANLAVANPMAGFRYDWYLGSTKLRDNSTTINGVKSTGNYYVVSTDNSTNCYSDASAEALQGIALVFQITPSPAPIISKQSTYLLGAAGNDIINGGNGGDYRWAFNGTEISGNSSNIQKPGSETGEYGVRRAYTYRLNGESIQCWSEIGKFTYAPDPNFEGVAVYPNPVSGSSIIDGKPVINFDFLEPIKWQNAKVSIYDLGGKLAIEKEIIFSNSSGIVHFDLSKLGNSMYILKIESKDGKNSYQGRIIINR